MARPHNIRLDLPSSIVYHQLSIVEYRYLIRKNKDDLRKRRIARGILDLLSTLRCFHAIARRRDVGRSPAEGD